MKILYFGGQKSGKSLLAETKTLELSNNKKPFYIATYDNSYDDVEMLKIISIHKLQRLNKFYTIEETNYLPNVIKVGETYLVDCISMWILNNENYSLEKLYKQLDLIISYKNNIVFVLNDVNKGIIPIDKLSRDFINRSGLIGQKLASLCDEVYEVKFGIEIKIK
jgi:adenosylcobinamide kinase/adenosylcobinamide-phosphate guanylyltransferase